VPSFTVTGAYSGSDSRMAIGVCALTGTGATVTIGTTAALGNIQPPEIQITPAASGSLIVGGLYPFNSSGTVTSWSPTAATTNLYQTTIAGALSDFALMSSATTTTGGDQITMGDTNSGWSSTQSMLLAEIEGTSVAVSGTAVGAIDYNLSQTSITSPPVTAALGTLLVAVYAIQGSVNSGQQQSIRDSLGLTWTSQVNYGTVIGTPNYRNQMQIWTATVTAGTSKTARGIVPSLVAQGVV
jgi:hypothetical protein